MRENIRYPLVMALVALGTVCLSQTLWGEEPGEKPTVAPVVSPAPPAPPMPAVHPSTPPAIPSAPVLPPGSVVVTGKIVVVDKVARTITLEVDGKLQMLRVDAKVKMVNDGKIVTLEQLAAGQEVSVLTRLGTGSVLEVVALSVEPANVQQEAAGKYDNNGKKKGQTVQPASSGTRVTPFSNFPNPANNLGPIISAER